jgi:type IV secretion system protein VirD4
VDEILLGQQWNPLTGRLGEPESYDLRSHISLIAPTGAGKGACFEIPNLLLGLRHSSVLSIDPSGQNAAVCAEARRRMRHEVWNANPFNMHVGQYPDMRDDGFNPVWRLPDPSAPTFTEEAMSLGDALISVEGDSQRHFPESAKGLATWLLMFVRLIEGDNGNLAMVRDLLTDDLQAVANAAVATGHDRIKSLAHKYTKPLTKELESVVSTAETQTRWLLSDPMRKSLSVREGIDFGKLKDRPTSCFLILPGGTELENHAVWLRLCVVSALNALYRRGGTGVPVVMLLSEFAQLGKLPPIKAAFGQARKYGIRLFPVLQDYGQLVAMEGRDGAGTFIANSGCVVGMAPGDPATAEWMSSFSDEQGEVNVNASLDPRAPGGVHIGYGEGHERVWSPGKIRRLPDFHSLVWRYGRSQPQPVYCPPYWTIRACRRAARPDPYHPHGMRSPLRRKLATGLAVACSFAALVIGGAWLF